MKKLMLLATGGLIVVALAAFSSTASAGEPPVKCTSLPCTFTVDTSSVVFSTIGGDIIICNSSSGSGSMTALEGTTGEATFTFHECKEQNTIFHFACTGTGQPSGTIKTNSVVLHTVYINAQKTSGILLTNFNVTFTCAGGFEPITLTGNLMGHLENTCGVGTKKLSYNFTTSGGVGQQTFKQVTGTGTVFDLTAKLNHPNISSFYVTASIAATWDFTFNQNVTPTC